MRGLVCKCMARDPSASPLDRAEYLSDDVARCPDRIFAERLFLLADHEVEAVERLLRDVALDGGLVLADQAELGALPGERVVLVSQPDAIGRLLHDRQEALGELRRGR